MQNSLNKHRIGCLTFDGRAKRLLLFIRPDDFVQRLSIQQPVFGCTTFAC